MQIYGMRLQIWKKRNESKEITTPTETTFKIIQPKKQSFFKRLRTAIWESIAINL